MENPNYDPVNAPVHYTSTSVECIDVMEETLGVDAVKDFCIANAFKYLFRHKMKNGDQDLEKARWYLNKWHELNNKKKENN